MTNNLVIKDGNSTLRTIHSIEDSTSVHYTQHVPSDVSGNIATVVSGGQAAQVGHGGLVIALSPNSPLPAGTAHLGKVSIAGAFDVSVGSVVIADNAPVSVRGGVVGATQSGTWTVQIGNTPNTTPVLVTVNNNIAVSVQNTIAVGTHAVTQSGVWAVNAALTSTNNNVALTSVGTNPVAVGTGAAATALRVAIAPNTDKTVIGAVSVADSVLAASQSGTWNIGSITTLPATPAGTNLIGGVSVRGIVSVVFDGANANMPVSVGTLPKLVANTDKVIIGAVSLADGTLPTGPVTQSGTWTVQIGNTPNTVPVLVTVNNNIAVSVQNAITVGTHAVTQSGVWAVNAALTSTNNNVALTSVGTNPVAVGTGAAATALRVAIAPNTDKTVIGAVSIADTAITVTGITGFTQTVLTGAATSVQSVQIAGTDGTNVRVPLLQTDGIMRVAGTVFTSQYAFARPADTTQYAIPNTTGMGQAGDLIANSTTNTAVKPLKFIAGRVNGGPSYIRRARLLRTGGGAASAFGAIIFANHKIRLHLFNTNNEVSVANGDNGAMLASPVSAYLGYIDLAPTTSTMGLRTTAGTSVLYYQGTPTGASEFVVALSANQVSVQGLLECLIGPFVPISGEIFTTQIDFFQS